VKTVLVAGVQSGCGKTSITLALLQYLRKAGKDVGAFKTGPDFLDPLWHQAMTHKPSYNLDSHMMGVEACRHTIYANQSEFVVIEGVMGLFDGREGVGGPGSGAHLAMELAIPVCLVVDAKGMSGSIVPLVKGFIQQANNQGFCITAIIANRVGSYRHADLLSGFLTQYGLPPLVAWLEKDAPVIAERHLGLTRPGETELPNFQTAFHVDEKQLLASFGQLEFFEPEQVEQKKLLSGLTIGIAEDDVCCFIYKANKDWLLEQGATLKTFSPLAGEDVPPADALWLPGGYPELYAQQLALSKTWKSLNAFIESGKPVLAECGGAMLLGEQLIDKQGEAWPMAGALPFTSRMQHKLASLGYRQSTDGVKGHEFHHSIRESTEDFDVAFDTDRGDKGLRYKNLRASYIHWYFASSPNTVAQWFRQAA